MEFRSLKLPESCPGRMLLHSMPGRHEPWEIFEQAAREQRITLLVSLAPLEEIEDKSPEYAFQISQPGRFWDFLNVPIPDFGVPHDVRLFNTAVRSVLDRLNAGQTVLAHCAAGIGRTGTFAACVLTGFGLSVNEATARVYYAGSHAETPSQIAFISGFAAQFDHSPAPPPAS